MTQLKEQYYAVEVPEDATDFTVDMEDDESVLYYFEGDNVDSTVLLLPEGNWQFLFTTKGMTEDQASSVVAHCKGYGYRNYECADYDGGSSPFDVWAAYHLKTGIESLHSLLRSQGLDTEKNYAILKKEP